MKYYLITYFSEGSLGISNYNDVIDHTPIKFLIDLQNEEKLGREWFIRFAMETSKEEFEQYNKQFE